MLTVSIKEDPAERISTPPPHTLLNIERKKRYELNKVEYFGPNSCPFNISIRSFRRSIEGGVA